MKKGMILSLGIVVFALFANVSVFADALFDSSVVSEEEWMRAFDCIECKSAGAVSGSGTCSFSLHSGILTEFEYEGVKVSGTNDVFFVFAAEEGAGYLSSKTKHFSGDDSECNFVFLLSAADGKKMYACLTDDNGAAAGKWTAVDLDTMDSYVALYNTVSGFGDSFKYFYKESKYDDFEFRSKKYKCYSLFRELDSGMFMQAFFFFDEEKKIGCIINKMYISGGSVFELHEFNYDMDYDSMPDVTAVFDNVTDSELFESDNEFRKIVKELGYGDGNSADSASAPAGDLENPENTAEGGVLLANELLKVSDDNDAILSKIKNASSKELFQALMHFEDEMGSSLDSAIRLAAFDTKADFPSNSKKRSFFSVYTVFLNEMSIRLDAVNNMSLWSKADVSAKYDPFYGEKFEDATGNGEAMTLYDLYVKGVQIEDNEELLRFAGSIKSQPLVRAVYHMKDSLATSLLMKMNESGVYVFKDAEHYIVPELYFLVYLQLSFRVYEVDYDSSKNFFTVGDIIFRIRNAMSSFAISVEIGKQSKDAVERELMNKMVHALGELVLNLYDLKFDSANGNISEISELMERYKEHLGKR